MPLSHSSSIYIAPVNFQGGLSIHRPLGHLDFYPNGGKNQPACGSDGSFSIFGLFNVGPANGCSHNLAKTYFLETITGGGPKFVAKRCLNWQTFQAGGCAALEDETFGFEQYGV